MKKVLLFITSITIALTTISCSKSEETENTKKKRKLQQLSFTSVESSSNETRLSNSETTQSVVDSTTLESEPVHTAYYMRSLGAPSKFRDNRAWVLLEDEVTIALIDTDGNILCKLNTAELADDLVIEHEYLGNLPQITPLSKGYSAIVYTDLGGSNSQKTGGAFAIIDESGKICYSSDDTDACTFRCQIGDKFFVVKDESSFSEKKYVLQQIDSYGNITVDDWSAEHESRNPLDIDPFGTIDPKSSGVYFDDIGDGLFTWESVLFNSEMNDIMPGGMKKVCKDGHVIMQMEQVCYDLSREDLVSRESIERAYSNESNKFNLHSSYDMDWVIARYNEGKWFDNDRTHSDINCFKDKSGNIVTVPDLPDRVQIETDPYYFVFPEFSGGYACLALKGADGNTYCCHIDGAGTLQYEPILIDRDSFQEYIFYYNGYLYFPYKALSPSGSFLYLGQDESSMLEQDIMNVRKSDSGYNKCSNGYWIYYDKAKSNLSSGDDPDKNHCIIYYISIRYEEDNINYARE